MDGVVVIFRKMKDKARRLVLASKRATRLDSKRPSQYSRAALPAWSQSHGLNLVIDAWKYQPRRETRNVFGFPCGDHANQGSLPCLMINLAPLRGDH